ncbi:MAG: hypothetical protein ABIK09_12300 [Pseudomonadota bacterium]
MRILTNMLLVLVVIAGSLMLNGCLDEENYMACSFAVEYNAECDTPEDDGGDTQKGINCVITTHPQCDDGICVRYQGSSPFCSMACLTSDDCPDDGICEEFAKGCDESGENCNHYCIKGNLAQ